MSEFAKFIGQHNLDSMLYDLLKEGLTKEQFRAIWTTYCIMSDLNPDTAEYDDKLLEVYDNYWCFTVKDYDEYDLYMGELLC